MPTGSIQCLFEKSNNHYSWKKVTTTVHNIIVGKLWIDQVGSIFNDMFLMDEGRKEINKECGGRE